MVIMAQQLRVKTSHQKDIAKKIQGLCGKHSKWAIWSDFVTMAACTLSIADIKKREERERMYANIAMKYDKVEMEQFCGILSDIIDAFEENPDQDVLGDLYMLFEMGNDRIGQVFTPYSVCKMIAKMQCSDIAARIEQKGYMTVNDPAVGAGALLIAFANECLAQGVNYQQHILFAGQDIDFTAAMMCYIQLSLLGCAGYVIVGDTLRTPPTEPLGNRNVWYTPMYYLDVWHWRRAIKALSKVEPHKAISDNESPRLAVGDDAQLSLF